jgi:hypothetical protein
MDLMVKDLISSIRMPVEVVVVAKVLPCSFSPMFTASLDRLAKIVPWGILLMTVGFSSIPVLIPSNSIWFMLFPIIILLIILLFTFLYSPQGYSVDIDHVVVHRRINNYFIPRKNLIEIREVSKEEMGLPIRLFGNGGVFGYTGIFRNRSLGSMEWFASQQKNYVLLTNDRKKKIILTPDDVNGFLEALKAL